MELRKCECDYGSFSALIEERMVVYVKCTCCGKSTWEFATEQAAIQAWNEGKVY